MDQSTPLSGTTQETLEERAARRAFELPPDWDWQEDYWSVDEPPHCKLEGGTCACGHMSYPYGSCVAGEIEDFALVEPALPPRAALRRRVCQRIGTRTRQRARRSSPRSGARSAGAAAAPSSGDDDPDPEADSDGGP